MRKVGTIEESDKKKGNYLIIALIIVVLMVLSTVGYSFIENKWNDDSIDKKRYNGFLFERYGDFWKMAIEGQEFYFQYLPEEVENISVRGLTEFNSYVNKPLYFVNNNFATGEILQNLNRYVSRYQEACIKKDELLIGGNCSDFPIKECESENIIVFELNKTENKVLIEGNCTFISGELVKSSDAFLYNLFGIIKTSF